MACLPVDSLLRLRLSSRLADEYVSATLKTRFRHLIRPFIDDYDLFDHTLIKLAAVIGSDGALGVLYPAFPMPDHIELFTPFETHTEMVGHLVEVEGYSIEDVLFQEQDCLPESVSCIAWVARGDFTIAVVASSSSSPLWPITAGWNTALFAYVTPNIFEHAYPGLTEESAALFNPERLLAGRRVPPPTFARMAADWVSDHGWLFGVMEDDLPTREACTGDNSALCGAVVRFFGDRHCTRGTLLALDDPFIRHPANQLTRYTAMWWRGGHLCSPQCHSGVLELTPQARTCLRSAVRFD
ncbi:hypothetical protein K466DRAFT_501817 [Polyporus arcularius HHB13444]|uniref:Uncharacterized protein n=1 Tax=Polyporus arcularius HHB13444 TaxID=1314778 RepID=A0A5C3NVZ3_9APHY|nr:hypothetical protein K466DRAFT_501817 [Polyporus arcularius HHB13444]